MKPMKMLDAIRLLEENGFKLIRSNGHVIYAYESVRIALPHQRIVSVGVMRSLVKAVQKAKSEFSKEKICA